MPLISKRMHGAAFVFRQFLTTQATFAWFVSKLGNNYLAATDIIIEQVASVAMPSIY
jgi:hypothetical protein